MVIQNNIIAKNTSRNQKIINQGTGKSLEKLSSGFRINRAGDDAAGLAISELMRSQINGLMQAERNVSDGIGMVQTMDGALTEVHSMLQRMKQLAVEAANGTYDDRQRANIQMEFDDLLEEMDRIGGATDFNSIPLFDADTPPATLVPPELSGTDPQISLQIGPSGDETMQINRYYMSSAGLKLDSTSISDINSANSAIPDIENAIQAVSEMRAHYGASQNHLDHTHRSITVTHENMASAESQIRDTDMADEYTNYTKQQVMMQASMAVLTQANALPQQVIAMFQ